MDNIAQGVTSEIIVGPAKLLVADIGSEIPQLDGDTIVWGEDWEQPGFTEKGTDLSYTPTFTDIKVDELMSAAKRMLTEEKGVISCVLAQATLDNLARSISASKLSTVAASSTKVGTKTLKVGGGQPEECMVALQGLSPEGYWRTIIAYRAQAQAAVKLAFSRTGMTSIPFELSLLPDATKPAGEQLFIIVDKVAAKTA